MQDENAWLLKGVAGHAGLFSNVPDLLRFAARDSRRRQRRTARQKSRLSTRRRWNSLPSGKGPEGSSRALGWDTPSENSSSGRHFSPHSIGHLGYSGCSLWIDLDAAVAVVLLTNRTWPDRKAS